LADSPPFRDKLLLRTIIPSNHSRSKFDLIVS